jgi:hypothetical protein
MEHLKHVKNKTVSYGYDSNSTIYSSEKKEMKGLYSPESTTACQTKHASHKCNSFKNLANTWNMIIATHKKNIIQISEHRYSVSMKLKPHIVVL